MAVKDGLTTFKNAVQIYMADPVSGNPSAPPGPTQARLNTVWGWALWVFAGTAAIAAVIALVVAVMNHQAGRSNDGLSRLGIILACCIGVGAIGGSIGALTGT